MELPKELLYNIINYNDISVLSGAGISAESGIPTFRNKSGLWEKYRPEDLACQTAFDANPSLVWSWYRFRRRIIAEAMPNRGHLALVKWEKLARDFTIITQNVDGLHSLAGNRNVIELHGNIHVNRCQVCGRESASPKNDAEDRLPYCECGGKLRPGVVWFGESLPDIAFRMALCAAEHCDLFITVGTSAVVYPAAALPEIAIKRGIPVVEINPETTPFSASATYHLRGQAGEILSALVDAYEVAHGQS